MVLSNVQIFTNLGFSTAPTRNALIADFLSGGMDGLVHMSEDDVRDACTSYAKRSDGNFPIILTTLQRQRMKSLVLWVKDMKRARQAASFPTGTSSADMLAALDASLERAGTRKEQKKVGETYLDHKFTNKLKSQAQYEKFSEELESTLSMIVGSQGVPLIYVIREEEAASFDDTIPYEEAIIQAVPLSGDKFNIDKRTVHQLVMNNVHEDSDAYTYVKPLLRRRDGRQDVLALRERYNSDATQQTIINEAKSTLDSLRYKNERSFSFERFSSKLQKAYDELEDNGRAVHNGDIVDALWSLIQDSSLQTYLASLRVDYQRNQRDYKLILQDIAAEVANIKKKVSFAPGTREVNATYVLEGTCPKNGVHTDDGSVFIGSYSRNQWASDLVRPYHGEIMEARSKNGGGKGSDEGASSRNKKRRANAVKRSKRKIRKLKAQLSAARTVSAGTCTGGEDCNSDDKSSDNAGDSFGGKRSKQS